MQSIVTVTQVLRARTGARIRFCVLHIHYRKILETKKLMNYEVGLDSQQPSACAALAGEDLMKFLDHNCHCGIGEP